MEPRTAIGATNVGARRVVSWRRSQRRGAARSVKVNEVSIHAALKAPNVRRQDGVQASPGQVMVVATNADLSVTAVDRRAPRVS